MKIWRSILLLAILDKIFKAILIKKISYIAKIYNLLYRIIFTPDEED